jgi:hypothetical protein
MFWQRPVQRAVLSSNQCSCAQHEHMAMTTNSSWWSGTVVVLGAVVCARGEPDGVSGLHVVHSMVAARLVDPSYWMVSMGCMY